MPKLTRSTNRKTRVRNKLRAISSLPRLSVFRSSEHIWAQVIDDKAGTTIAAANDRAADKKSTKSERAAQVGTEIAKLTLKKKIKKVAFDRGAYKYHGRIKALAEAARKEGLEF